MAFKRKCCFVARMTALRFPFDPMGKTVAVSVLMSLSFFATCRRRGSIFEMLRVSDLNKNTACADISERNPQGVVQSHSKFVASRQKVMLWRRRLRTPSPNSSLNAQQPKHNYHSHFLKMRLLHHCSHIRRNAFRAPGLLLHLFGKVSKARNRPRWRRWRRLPQIFGGFIDVVHCNITPEKLDLVWSTHFNKVEIVQVAQKPYPRRRYLGSKTKVNWEIGLREASEQ